jgi:hypothetical protein
MFLSELIDLRTRESPTEVPHFSFRLESPYSEPLFEPNLGGRHDSVTLRSKNFLQGPPTLCRMVLPQSQIIIRGAEVNGQRLAG